MLYIYTYIKKNITHLFDILSGNTTAQNQTHSLAQKEDEKLTKG